MEVAKKKNFRAIWIVVAFVIPLIVILFSPYVTCRCAIGRVKGNGILFVGIVARIRSIIGVFRPASTKAALTCMALPIIMILLAGFLFSH